MAEVASAYVSLIPSAKGFTSGVTRETDAAARTAGKRFGGIFSGSLKSVIGGALAGIGVTRLLGDALGEAREAQKVGALTVSTIKATGGAANVSAEKVGNLATAISNKVGVDDEAIQSGENMLLTFKNIRNEAGRGNKIFDQATRTTTDLAAAMAAASGGELNFRSASIQMGKALNDPIKGVTALGRVGVTFTAQQKDQIKALVESGNVMGAQKIILKELKSEFGGAAEAQATAGDKATVAWKNLEEQVGTALVPVIDNLAKRLTDDVIPAVSEFITEMQDGTGNGGKFVDVLEDTVDVGKNIVGFFNSLPGPVKKYGAELAIAAVVTSKLNSSLSLVTGGMGRYVSSITAAETRSAKLTTGLQGLGAGLRNVAGAGGMLLIADGAKKAGTGMSVLESAAGGALSGAALGAFGGPPGAAIGAAIGGLAGATFALSNNTRHAGNAAKVSLPSWKEYATTLDGVAASTTKATRELVFNRLETSGLLKATRELGLSDREAVKAVLGQTDARHKLNVALFDEERFHRQHLADNIVQALYNETGAINRSRQAQLEKNLAIAKTKAEVDKAQAALDKFARTHADATIGLTGAQKVRRELSSISAALAQVFGTAPDANTAGVGGLDVLLNPKRRRATGGPVLAGQPYIVGEKRPELFVPSTNGRIVPRVPTVVGSPAGAAPGPQFVVETVYAQDVNDFLRQMQTRARHAAIGGVPQ